MGAEQAHYPDRQRVNKLITNLVILLSLKYLPTEMAVFVWKKIAQKVPRMIFVLLISLVFVQMFSLLAT